MQKNVYSSSYGLNGEDCDVLGADRGKLYKALKERIDDATVEEPELDILRSLVVGGVPLWVEVKPLLDAIPAGESANNFLVFVLF